MITKLQLERFKSWRTTGEMQLAPLTGLFGSNSSGKTSLLQWLLLLKQTAESPDRSQPLFLGDERSLIDLGTFPDILFQRDLESNLSWRLDWTLPKNLSIIDPTEAQKLSIQGQNLGFDATLYWKNNEKMATGRVTVKRFTYRFAGSTFGLHQSENKPTEYELDSDGFSFKRQLGRAWSLPAPMKSYGFPDQVRAYYQNASFLSDLELEFENLTKRMFYLGPLREYPKRQYTWAGSRPLDMGARGERFVDALLAAREDGNYIKRGKGLRKMNLEGRVAQWLKELKLVSSFEIQAVTEGSKLFQVRVQRSPASPPVPITDVGFGVSQILPVIALCYYVPEGSTIILEQPEIHLHPRVQAGLADVFIDAIATRHIQIILESHSEHLLRRLQRRIAEEKFSSEDARLYFCKMVDGESSLDALRLNEYGNIENWPEDFFGDEFGEMAAMTEAIIKRKRSQKP